MELDARTAADGLTLETDVCIVGAGPAGLALAWALQSSGMGVVLIESGRHGRDRAADDLNRGDSLGDPYPDLMAARSRTIGGTSAIWNTMVGGMPHAKYVPLDRIDFERRDWIPESGWPVTRAMLEPYYRKAEVVAGLEPAGADSATLEAGRGSPLSFPDGSLVSAVYRFGAAERFGIVLPAALHLSQDVTLLYGATVTELATTDGGARVAAAGWATRSGTRGAVRASWFVLASGGIENARLLLLSNHSHAWLGRGFMEHPVDGTLRLVTRSPALAPDAGFYGYPAGVDGPARMGRIGLSPELLHSEKLMNASLRLIVDEEPAVLHSESLRPAARRLVPFPRLRRVVGDAIRGIGAATGGLSPARYRILIDLEQAPHRDNRVVLSERRDVFGRPVAALHWRWREKDQANREHIRSIVAREIERAGAGRIESAVQVALDPNSHHQMGATRMHPDPGEGVVDQHLRVHGVENLYATGSSVFPTAGFANPTFTILALTLRLADRLSGREYAASS